MDFTLATSIAQPSVNNVCSSMRKWAEDNLPVRLTSSVLILFDAFNLSSLPDFPAEKVNTDDQNYPFLAEVWEHARRRAEDQTILLLNPEISPSAPAFCALQQLLPSFPNIPDPIFSTLRVLSPFFGPGRSSVALSVEISLDLSGDVLATRLRLADDKPDRARIQSIVASASAFAYLIHSASPAEQETLSLQNSIDKYIVFSENLQHRLPPTQAQVDSWRQALLECSLTGTSALGSIFAIMSGILLLANSDPDDIFEGASLLGLSPEKFDPDSIINDSSKRFDIIHSAYQSLLMAVVSTLNNFLSTIDSSQNVLETDAVCAVVSVVDAPLSYRPLSLKPIFESDPSEGYISSEMVADGINIPQTPLWITQTLKHQEPTSSLINTFAIDLTSLVESDSLLARDLHSTSFSMSSLIASSRVWHMINIATNDPSGSPYSPGSLNWSQSTVMAQIRSWFFVNWLHKYSATDFTADFSIDEFIDRYSSILHSSGVDPSYPYALETWAQTQRGWGADGFFHGKQRIWLREDVWRTLEGELDGMLLSQRQMPYGVPVQEFYSSPPEQSTINASMSRDNLLGYSQNEDLTMMGSEFAANDPEAIGRKVEVVQTSRKRKLWLTVVWAMSFFVPSFLLRYIGQMKRPDVRIAWREKFAICVLIVLMNGFMIFYMIFLGNLICPEYDKVWTAHEVSLHSGTSDFYVSIRGEVYDITKFWKLQHSDTDIETSKSTMEPFAGLDLTEYFPPPLTEACSGLVSNDEVWLLPNNTPTYSSAIHYSGPYKQSDEDSKLYKITWMEKVFKPKIKQYYKGGLVVKKSVFESYGSDGFNNWAIIDDSIYDLTDYFNTIDTYSSDDYEFMNTDISDLFKDYAGEDITEKFNALSVSSTTKSEHLTCFKNVFYAGKIDFRKSAKCQTSNYILLSIALILSSVVIVKFLASLQLGSKPMPVLQEKFVICQIPAYTEGEEQLRNAIDSLTALKYDNKRKLLFIICDGMITGAGNDLPTPNIVLDILGSDPRLDPPALPFKSVGEGSKQLNYGKVYSGLYEFEGNVVPYIVVVKVGSPSEKSRPGNRGKRDSQILLLDFLNKVHFQAAMSPFQLELFHQINNVIGVDPELYEYVLMVDGDTSLAPDSLNRLVASCVRDSRIVGTAGETSLQNEDDSWWTMIQVYEYYISHHLSKSFESLFGSVTCLPGCFCMYRIRTADKGRPLVIANEILQEYGDGNVNTLHKKNLLALGEDRYLTTLMTRHYPKMRFTFVPEAHAQTAAPETWSILLSQRRRWINSTIHNLFELALLPDLCGFCLFSMRFIVWVDLIGTLMLPSIVVYIGYLLYVIISKSGAFPLISVCMIAGVYGLQALVFLIRRQWQHIGWMIIYILAYPIYSFALPVYSFWNQDNFSWGNTRIVVGESGDKQLVAVDDEGFDERSIPLQTWDEFAAINNLPGRQRPQIAGLKEKPYATVHANQAAAEESYEMDDMQSIYSGHPPRPVSMYSGLRGGARAPPSIHPDPRNSYQRPAYTQSYIPSVYNAQSVQRPGSRLDGYNGSSMDRRMSMMSDMTLYQQQQAMLQHRQATMHQLTETMYDNSIAGKPKYL
ncbi:chitin synthase-domain-containing protein [Lipomyces oligophaga]|uniref:chitin synthase-domain-containing protein n=1 Tax=Lipomyces oligophaga TaxID=45792 RepID=UPI0034CFC3E0